MSVAHLRKEVSIEEFLAGIEDDELFERCEYWDGEIIPKDPEPGDPMSPINLHAYLQIQLGRRLANYLDEHPVVRYCPKSTLISGQLGGCSCRTSLLCWVRWT